ncbi:MAG: DUF2963 domain-containing protein [Candidatus Phytoplasma pruni]|nr:DUF2963 domain-containing protein [Candidatus Phytoplasma pruni]
MRKQIKNNQKVLFKFFCFIVLLIVISAIISKIIFLQNTDSAFKKVDNSANKLHSNLDDIKVEFKQNFDKLNSKLDRCINVANKKNKPDSEPNEANKENKQNSKPTETVKEPVKVPEQQEQKKENELKYAYQEDGKTINCIEEYDKDTEKLIKDTKFYKDGKTISCIEEYDKDTGNKIKKTFFDKVSD